MVVRLGWEGEDQGARGQGQSWNGAGRGWIGSTHMQPYLTPFLFLFPTSLCSDIALYLPALQMDVQPAQSGRSGLPARTPESCTAAKSFTVLLRQHATVECMFSWHTPSVELAAILCIFS